MKSRHSDRTVRLALSLSIVSASDGLLPIFTSAGEPPSSVLSRAHQRSHCAVVDPRYSAFTHRLCQFDFVLDGIKRDRLTPPRSADADARVRRSLQRQC